MSRGIFRRRQRVKKLNGVIGLIGVLCAGVCAGIARADSPVTPFLNAQTNAVIYADLSHIDMDAVAAWQQKLQANAPQDDPMVQRQIRRSQAQMIKAKQWVTDFKAAGGTDIYVVAQLGGMFMGQPGEVVTPLGAGANADALAQVFVPGGDTAPPPPQGDPNAPPPPGPGYGRPQPATAVIGQSLVYSTSAMVESLKNAQPAPRPDLEAALAAGTAPLRIAVSPASIKNLPLFKMMAARMAGGAGGPGGPGGPGGNVPFSEPQWDAVTWVLIAINPPPTESGSVIFQCKDADSANALSALLTQKLQDWKNNPQAQQNLGDQLPKMADALKPAVSGSQVTMSLDQTTLDAVAQKAAAMRAMRRPPRQMPPDDSGGQGGPGGEGPPGGPGGADNGPPPGQ
jgi:hypothetical protein